MNQFEFGKKHYKCCYKITKLIDYINFQFIFISKSILEFEAFFLYRNMCSLFFDTVFVYTFVVISQLNNMSLRLLGRTVYTKNHIFSFVL